MLTAKMSNAPKAYGRVLAKVARSSGSIGGKVLLSRAEVIAFVPEQPGRHRNEPIDQYSEDMIRLNRNGVRGTVRPSGHVIRTSFDKIDAGGSIPPNVTEAAFDMPETMMKMGNNAANDLYTKRCKEEGIKIHPARFPSLLPKFFIKMLTDPGDIVLDPFAGSLTAGAVAEELERQWIGGEAVEEYLRAGIFRFEELRRNPTLF